MVNRLNTMIRMTVYSSCNTLLGVHEMCGRIITIVLVLITKMKYALLKCFLVLV